MKRRRLAIRQLRGGAGRKPNTMSVGWGSWVGGATRPVFLHVHHPSNPPRPHPHPGSVMFVVQHGAAVHGEGLEHCAVSGLIPALQSRCSMFHDSVGGLTPQTGNHTFCFYSGDWRNVGKHTCQQPCVDWLPAGKRPPDIQCVRRQMWQMSAADTSGIQGASQQGHQGSVGPLAPWRC